MTIQKRQWYHDPWKLWGAIGVAALAVAAIFWLLHKQPSPQPPSQPQSLVALRQVWEGDSCLHMKAELIGVVLSDTPTDLCSTSVQENGFTYYYLFSRQSSANQWVEVISNYGGYRYFMYPNMPWLRQDLNAGPVQIKVQDASGTTSWEDLSTFNPGLPFYSRLGSAEDVVNQLANQVYHAQLNTGTMSQSQSQRAQSQVSSQEAQIQQLQTQLDQTRQQLQNEQNSQVIDNEEQFLEQENAREWRIVTAPPCYYSYNGCGP